MLCRYRNSPFSLLAALLSVFLAPTALSQVVQSSDVIIEESQAISENVPQSTPGIPVEPKAQEVISDLLIVLDTDGRSHTAQHTISSNGPTISLSLPGSVVPQEVLLFGPAKNPDESHNMNSRLLTLTQGTAFVRYQHQYGSEVQMLGNGNYVLTTASIPSSIEVDALRLNRSATTWVFPSEYELISYTVTNKDTGQWVAVDNTLTFHQLSDESVSLSINYRKKVTIPRTEDSECGSGNADDGDCAIDKDKDGVPDYRDICESKLGQENNEFGCATDHSMILSSVDFDTGRTYLGINARAVLNRVAKAISISEHQFFEIGAHTDDVGATNSNLQLSKKRADAVRHYLILKGVNPNVIRATGYGEQYPIRDNQNPEGRRANRRVELVVLQ